MVKARERVKEVALAFGKMKERTIRTIERFRVFLRKREKEEKREKNDNGKKEERRS